MKKYTFLFVVLIFVSTSFAAGIFALAGQAHALTLQHCTNEKWGGNVIVDIIGRDPRDGPKEIPWMTLEELREVLNEYSEHVSEEFREEVNDWIDSGVYEEKTFKYRSFKLDLDPITEVWMFPDDANRFVELDTDFTPYWDVPAESGTWTSTFTYVGPDSTPYVQGGVKFNTDGGGLLAPISFTLEKFADPGGDHFSFESIMAETGRFSIGTELAGMPDTATHWDVFLYDSLTESYTFHDDSPCIPEPSTLVLFALGVLGLAARGRRVA